MAYKEQRLTAVKEWKTLVSGMLATDASFAAAVNSALTSANAPGSTLMRRIASLQNYRLAYWRSAADEINYRYAIF